MRVHHVAPVALALALALALIAAGCGSSGQKTNSQTQKEVAQKQWAGARANVLGNLAKEQYEGGNFDKARETIDQALKIDPDNAALLVLSARISIEQGVLERADKDLTLARRLDPKNAEADYLTGVVCQRWQKTQDAFDFYRSAAEKQPSELAYLLAQAETLVALNRADEALALLQARVVFFEYSGAIRDVVGQLLMQRGMYRQATDMLRQASILASEDNTIREHLALAYYQSKQYRDAADVLGRLLKDEKYARRADLHLAMGECLLQMNKPRDARDSFEAASEANPNSPAAHMGLAKAAMQINDLRRAEIALKRSLSVDPAAGEAYLLLGYVRLKQEKLDEALASFRKAAALDESDTVSLCMVGFVLEKKGKSEEALKYYSRALKLRPGDELATRLMAEVQLDR
jgi:tetratricopeptide (TPR) repeat protein